MLKRFALYFTLFCWPKLASEQLKLIIWVRLIMTAKKNNSWIQQKTLGYGPYGYVLKACSKNDSTNCEFVAKVQRHYQAFKNRETSTIEKQPFLQNWPVKT